MATDLSTPANNALIRAVNSLRGLSLASHFVAFALIGLLLAGCSTPQPRSDQAPVDIPGAEGTGVVQHAFDDPQVAAIWTSAEISRSKKRYAEASELIEEALRIVPDDPVLWSRLAELRLQLGEHALAENYAAKSNAISAASRVLQYRNWLIIQHARDERGDVLGAREAQLEVRKYAPE